MMDPTMNLINETHYSYERKKYVFIVFWKYTIILHAKSSICLHNHHDVPKSDLQK